MKIALKIVALFTQNYPSIPHITANPRGNSLFTFPPKKYFKEKPSFGKFFDYTQPEKCLIFILLFKVFLQQTIVTTTTTTTTVIIPFAFFAAICSLRTRKERGRERERERVRERERERERWKGSKGLCFSCSHKFLIFIVLLQNT